MRVRHARSARRPSAPEPFVFLSPWKTCWSRDYYTSRPALREVTFLLPSIYTATRNHLAGKCRRRSAWLIHIRLSRFARCFSLIFITGLCCGCSWFRLADRCASVLRRVCVVRVLSSFDLLSFQFGGCDDEIKGFLVSYLPFDAIERIFLCQPG